jgi:hypothetical protein
MWSEGCVGLVCVGDRLTLPSVVANTGTAPTDRFVAYVDAVSPTPPAGSYRGRGTCAATGAATPASMVPSPARSGRRSRRRVGGRSVPRVDRVVRGRRLVGGQPSVRDDRLVEAAGNRREITYRCGTDAWSRLGAIGTRGAIGLGPGNHCEVAISRDTGWSEACNRCRAIGPRPAIGPGPATTRDTPSSEGSAAGPGWAGARDEELVNWPQATAGRPDRRSPAPAGPGQTAPRSGRRSTGV